jgi:hypothetical protein
MAQTKSNIVESPKELNLKEAITIDDVRELVGSVSDDRTWRLVVTYGGIAYLCGRDEVRRRMPPKIRNYPLGIEFGDPRIAEDRIEAAKRDVKLLGEESNMIYMQFEAFCQNNGYVGEKAAKDDAWVKRLHGGILRNWPDPEYGSTYIDLY